MIEVMVLHEARTKRGPFGGTVLTTLCGRMNAKSADGMNIASAGERVTCKFCLRKMQANSRGAGVSK